MTIQSYEQWIRKAIVPLHRQIKKTTNMQKEEKNFRSYYDEAEEESHDYFDINDCYDYEGNFDYGRLEDAIMDGEYVPEDW